MPRWAARFLDGWRPDAAVFIESELWPNLVAAAAGRGIPLALVNGRMSSASARWWARAPGLAGRVLRAFRLVLAQTEADAERLRALGASALKFFPASVLGPGGIAAMRAVLLMTLSTPSCSNTRIFFGFFTRAMVRLIPK